MQQEPEETSPDDSAAAAMLVTDEPAMPVSSPPPEVKADEIKEILSEQAMINDNMEMYEIDPSYDNFEYVLQQFELFAYNLAKSDPYSGPNTANDFTATINDLKKRGMEDYEKYKYHLVKELEALSKQLNGYAKLVLHHLETKIKKIGATPAPPKRTKRATEEGAEPEKSPDKSESSYSPDSPEKKKPESEDKFEGWGSGGSGKEEAVSKYNSIVDSEGRVAEPDKVAEDLRTQVEAWFRSQAAAELLPHMTGILGLYHRRYENPNVEMYKEFAQFLYTNVLVQRITMPKHLPETILSDMQPETIFPKAGLKSLFSSFGVLSERDLKKWVDGVSSALKSIGAFRDPDGFKLKPVEDDDYVPTPLEQEEEPVQEAPRPRPDAGKRVKAKMSPLEYVQYATEMADGVTEFSLRDITNMHPNIEFNMNSLRQAFHRAEQKGILAKRKQGRTVYYSLPAGAAPEPPAAPEPAPPAPSVRTYSTQDDEKAVPQEVGGVPAPVKQQSLDNLPDVPNINVEAGSRSRSRSKASTGFVVLDAEIKDVSPPKTAIDSEAAPILQAAGDDGVSHHSVPAVEQKESAPPSKATAQRSRPASAYESKATDKSSSSSSSGSGTSATSAATTGIARGMNVSRREARELRAIERFLEEHKARFPARARDFDLMFSTDRWRQYYTYNDHLGRLVKKHNFTTHLVRRAPPEVNRRRERGRVRFEEHVRLHFHPDTHLRKQELEKSKQYDDFARVHERGQQARLGEYISMNILPAMLYITIRKSVQIEALRILCQRLIQHARGAATKIMLKHSPKSGKFSYRNWISTSIMAHLEVDGLLRKFLNVSNDRRKTLQILVRQNIAKGQIHQLWESRHSFL